MARLSVPTKARLPPTLRLESSHPAVIKSLNRLSRQSLLSLALDWLQDGALPNALPYLTTAESSSYDDDPDDLYPPCHSLDELRSLYTDLQSQKGAKRDVVARITEGDWRHGLTLYQLAMVDFCHLDQHPTTLRWSAYAIVFLKPPSKEDEEQAVKVDDKSLTIPRFHPSTFLQSLQQQLPPDIKAHYHFYRPTQFPVLLLRVFVIDSPYNTSLALSGAASSSTSLHTSRTVYLAFPDGSPSLYISKSQIVGGAAAAGGAGVGTGPGEAKSLHSLIVSGVPKALSRPRERYTLRSTNLSSKNLGALLDRRGSGRSNAAGGGWSIYANERAKKSPLDSVLPTPPLAPPQKPSPPEPPPDPLSRKRHIPTMSWLRERKRAKLIALARFGDSAHVTDGKGLEKVQVLMRDPFPTSRASPHVPDEGNGQDEQQQQQSRPSRRRSKLDAALSQAQADLDGGQDEVDATRWTPAVKLTFQGPHVFAGVRQLVEAGIVDGERMPGWMTGEEGVTAGTIRHGRIRGHKGSGLYQI